MLIQLAGLTIETGGFLSIRHADGRELLLEPDQSEGGWRRPAMVREAGNVHAWLRGLHIIVEGPLRPRLPLAGGPDGDLNGAPVLALSASHLTPVQ